MTPASESRQIDDKQACVWLCFCDLKFLAGRARTPPRASVMLFMKRVSSRHRTTGCLALLCCCSSHRRGNLPMKLCRKKTSTKGLHYIIFLMFLFVCRWRALLILQRCWFFPVLWWAIEFLLTTQETNFRLLMFLTFCTSSFQQIQKYENIKLKAFLWTSEN